MPPTLQLESSRVVYVNVPKGSRKHVSDNQVGRGSYADVFLAKYLRGSGSGDPIAVKKLRMNPSKDFKVRPCSFTSCILLIPVMKENAPRDC